MKDLVILVPDKNTQFAMQGALRRPDALGIRPLSYEFRPHPGRDGGARTTGVDVLARERRRFSHALLVFDLEGSGAPRGMTSEALEAKLDADLSAQWSGSAKTIVIAPELDAWIWGSDNVLQSALEWPLNDGIRTWLRGKNFQFDVNDKPIRPKEALEALVPIHQLPRSSALYEKITRQLSLQRCVDPSFLRLRDTLRSWFAA